MQTTVAVAAAPDCHPTYCSYTLSMQRFTVGLMLQTQQCLDAWSIGPYKDGPPLYTRDSLEQNWPHAEHVSHSALPPLHGLLYLSGPFGRCTAPSAFAPVSHLVHFDSAHIHALCAERRRQPMHILHRC